jgi:phosphoserine phosphatase RsbU/P
MAPAANRSDRPRILVADDQIDILQTIEILLKKEGYEIRTVASPADALAAIKETTFDLILMDLNYSRQAASVREGIDLLVRIEDIDPLIPVVVMTAWASIDLAVEAMNAGAANFIQKPWDNGILIALVQEQIEKGRSRRRLENRRMQERLELEEAEQVQRAFLPSSLPKIDGCDMAVRWQPKGRVGGDYYDVFLLDDQRLGFCVADASGKGLPAALLMSNLQAGLRSLAGSTTGPAETVIRLNRLLCANRFIDKFITLFYGVLDLSRMELIYTNAGHPPPFIRRQAGGMTALNGTGGLVGCFADWTYSQESVRLSHGDRIWLYTDGISEARDASGNEYGTVHLERLIDELHNISPEEAQSRIWASVLEFCGGVLEDDATLLTFRLKPRFIPTRMPVPGDADRHGSQTPPFAPRFK